MIESILHLLTDWARTPLPGNKILSILMQALVIISLLLAFLVVLVSLPFTYKD